MCPLLYVQLVVRLQPDEAIYLKMIVKEPGARGFCKGVCGCVPGGQPR